MALSQLRFRFPPRRIFPIAACLLAGIEVQPALALTMLYLRVIRNYWVALARSYSRSSRNRNLDRPFFLWRRKKLLILGYGCGLESSAEIIAVVEGATERKEM